MNRYPTARLSLILLAVAVIVTAGLRGTSSADATPCFALLVGINDYQHVPKLNGCVQDVSDMRDVLVRKYHFSAENILTLTDAQATHEAIVHAFQRHLIDNARRNPNAIVMFVYSGHGSTVDDTVGTKASGVHSTLVPVDSRDPAAQHFDIRDDEVAALVGTLCQHTTNVTLIFDSCHSGSVNRDVGGPNVRTVSRDLRVQPSRPAAAVASAPPIGDIALVDQLPFNQRYVAISACQWYETAKEMQVGNRFNGALIGHLVPALWRARSDATCRAILEEVATGVTRRYVDQHPLVEGDLHRVLLAGAMAREDPFIKVDHAEGGTLVIQAGAAQGLQPGMLLAIYDSQALHLAGEEHKLATATVSSVTPLTATAVLPRPQAIPSTARVIVVTPLLGSERLRVLLSNDVDADLGRRLRSSSLLEPASDAAWDVKVARGTFGDLFNSPSVAAPNSSRTAPLPAASTMVSYVAAHDGRPLLGFFAPASDAAAVEKTVDALEKLARQRNLKALTHATSSLSDAIGLTVLRVQGKPSANFRFDVQKEETMADNRLDCPLKVGDYFEVQIENRANTDLYVTLFDLGPDGSVHILFPPSGAGERFPKGRRIKLPEVFQATPPLGAEVLKVVATTLPTDFSYLVQGGARRTSAMDNVPQSAVEQLLGRAFGQHRDLVVEGKAAEDWTTSQVNLRIEEARR